MKPNPLPFLRERWDGVPEPTSSFAGKAVIVTGSNTGIGFEAAAKFTTLGASKVVLAVRDASKGAAARQRIEQKTSRKGSVEVWELDMSSYASIQAFAARVDQELPRLDVLVLNAGITAKDYVVGAEGWESTLQVNVLSTALVGLLLLPKLKTSSKTSRADSDIPHLIIVTSEAHRWLEAGDLPDSAQYGGNMLQGVNAKPTADNKWDPLMQNARSKLFAMYISQALSDLAMGKSDDKSTPEAIVTSVCPGACKSELMRELDGIGRKMGLAVFDMLFNKSTESGGWTYVAAASLGKEAHGRWYKTTALTTPGEFVTSAKGKELQRQVWEEIVQSLEGKVPAVRALAAGSS